MKKPIDSSHISKDLFEDEVNKLKKWYLYYHKLHTCHKSKYKKLKKIKLALNMTSIGLTVTGPVVGRVTMNPII